MFLKLDGGETEPIGNRIIEMPEDTERTEVLRDPRSSFIATCRPAASRRARRSSAPVAARRPRARSATVRADLKGLGPVPGLAGRSPSYTVRQLYDTQQRAKASGPI